MGNGDCLDQLGPKRDRRGNTLEVRVRFTSATRPMTQLSDRNTTSPWANPHTMEHVAPGTRAKQRLLQQSCYSSQKRAALSKNRGSKLPTRRFQNSCLRRRDHCLDSLAQIYSRNIQNYNGNSFGIEEAVAKASKAKGPNAIVTHFRKIEGKCVER